MPNLQLGKLGESAVVRYIRRHGGVVIARNIHYRCGELDIVAWWRGRLCFMEVKTRSQASDLLGGLEEAMTEAKVQRFAAAAEMFMQGVDPKISYKCWVVWVWPKGKNYLGLRFFELS